MENSCSESWTSLIHQNIDTFDSIDISKWSVDTMKKKWNEIIIHTVIETELNENAEKIMTKNAKIS